MDTKTKKLQLGLDILPRLEQPETDPKNPGLGRKPNRYFYPIGFYCGGPACLGPDSTQVRWKYPKYPKILVYVRYIWVF